MDGLGKGRGADGEGEGKDVENEVLFTYASFTKGSLCIIQRISSKAADTCRT